MDPVSIALMGTQALISLGSLINSWNSNRKSNNLSERSLNENLRSNYYSYMDQLEGWRGDLSQTSLAMDQTLEDIASNRNYLSRWAEEYDLSMKNGVDEAFGQYQQMASNLGASIVSSAEMGASGGSAALVNAMGARSLMDANGGRTGRFDLSGRLGSYLKINALDMLADRQTAMSAVDTGYKALGSYQKAMESLQANIASMEKTTGKIAKKLDKEGMTV